MTHEEAIQEQATERYMLGHLPPNERDAFEEHYFGCAVCADDVSSTSTMIETMRASVQQANVIVQRQTARWEKTKYATLAAAASLAIGALTMQFAFVGPLQTRLAAALRPMPP